ncbi:MAG: hypothetical protein ABJH04_07765 [Cyclobacteriaceae bacterium]
MPQINLAEAQLIGFAHASRGYSILELADSMALNKSEWLKLRDPVNLKPIDKAELDERFGVREK